jgi:hypothetical protein
MADLGFRCPPVTVVVRVARLARGPRAARMGFGPVWSRTPLALRSSATRDRLAGWARQGRFPAANPRWPGMLAEVVANLGCWLGQGSS